jgi:hypothetical protein
MRVKRQRPEVPNLNDFPWLQVRPTRTTSTVPPRGPLEPGGKVPIQLAALDPGELAVIFEALCHVPRERAVCILDERVAREEARHLDLNVIGVVGLLLRWKERGWLSELRRYLDLPSAKGFFVDKQFRAEALKLAGESEVDPEQG